MKNTAIAILRVGMAITFLWIGILIIRNPETWGGFLQPWAAGLLPFPIRETMIATAIFDILVGFALLVEKFVLAASALGFLHLILVMVVSGINAVTVRDIGLAAGTLALFFAALPPKKF